MNRYRYTGTKSRFRPVPCTGSDYPVPSLRQPKRDEPERTGMVPVRPVPLTSLSCRYRSRKLQPTKVDGQPLCQSIFYSLGDTFIIYTYIVYKYLYINKVFIEVRKWHDIPQNLNRSVHAVDTLVQRCPYSLLLVFLIIAY